MVMEWTGRPLQQRRKPQKLGGLGQNICNTSKFIQLANGWGHAHQTDSPTLLLWLSTKLHVHWIFGSTTFAFCITGWIVLLSCNELQQNTPPHPPPTCYNLTKITEMTGRHSCSQLAVSAHLPASYHPFLTEAEKNLSDCGQTSKPLQNWN